MWLIRCMVTTPGLKAGWFSSESTMCMCVGQKKTNVSFGRIFMLINFCVAVVMLSCWYLVVML